MVIAIFIYDGISLGPNLMLCFNILSAGDVTGDVFIRPLLTKRI